MGITYNPKLETLVVAKVLQNVGSFVTTDGYVEPLSFSFPPYKILWRAYEALNDKDIEITPFTVANLLDSLGQLNVINIDGESSLRGKDAINYLMRLENDGIKTTPLTSFAFQLQKSVARRDMIEFLVIAEEKIKSGEDPVEVLSYLDTSSGKISLASGAMSSSLEEPPSIARGILDEYTHAVKYGSLYIETGLDAWDTPVGGVYPGRVYVIAGSSGDGKSTLLQNIIYRTSFLNNVKSGLISMEQNNKEVGKRFIQMMTGIDPIDIEKGRIPKNKISEFEKALKAIDKSNMIYDDSPMLTMPQVRMKLRKMASSGVKYVGVDQLSQLQLVSGGGNYGDTDSKVYLLKAYARELNLGIVSPHQLKKSVNDFRRGGAFDVSLSDLSESGERGADAVCFIRHDEEKQMILWMKARQGKKRNMVLDYDYMTTLFSNSKYQDIPEEFGGDINA